MNTITKLPNVITDLLNPNKPLVGDPVPVKPRRARKPSKPYLSYRKLKIRKAEHKWLINTMNVLKDMRPEARKIVGDELVGFDMGTEFDRDYDEDDKPKNVRECSAVGCIYGWMGALSISEGNELGCSEPNDWAHSPALEPLFYPHHLDYSTVTPKMAAGAIRTFLQTGKVRFRGATVISSAMDDIGYGFARLAGRIFGK